MEKELIPASMLNAFLYCERRFYLEHVERVMADNIHVLDGRTRHEKPLRGQPALRSRKKDETVTTRSVTLDSESLGLIAVLDLLEEKDGVSYPVEHKRQHAPRNADDQPYAWDNDEVQLCVQVLLLEEHQGSPVEKGYVYYHGSRERVEVAITPELREKTIRAAERAREVSRLPSAPEPLHESNRCPACSLLPICLPEETIALRSGNANLTGSARALAPIDDSRTFYVQEQGAYLSKQGESIVVTKHGEKLGTMPLADLSEVIIFGNVQLSTPAMQLLMQRHIPVSFLSAYGRYIGLLQPETSPHGPLRKKQYAASLNPEFSLTLARKIVNAKIHNCRVLLMRSLRAHGDDWEEEDTATTEPDDLAVLRLRDMEGKALAASGVEELLGIEGSAAHFYFQNFSRMIRDPEGNSFFNFENRNRRPPRDPINTLLSFAYAMLARDLHAAILAAGLDPFVGFYHSEKHGRPALALDLMEEFRPIVADSVVLTLVNKKMLSSSDFIHFQDAWMLSESGRKTFFGTYETRKRTVIKHPVFGYKVDYRRAMETQVRFLAAVLRGDIPEYQGFRVR